MSRSGSSSSESTTSPTSPNKPRMASIAMTILSANRMKRQTSEQAPPATKPTFAGAAWSVLAANKLKRSASQPADDTTPLTFTAMKAASKFKLGLRRKAASESDMEARPSSRYTAAALLAEERAKRGCGSARSHGLPRSVSTPAPASLVSPEMTQQPETTRHYSAAALLAKEREKRRRAMSVDNTSFASNQEPEVTEYSDATLVLPSRLRKSVSFQSEVGADNESDQGKQVPDDASHGTPQHSTLSAIPPNITEEEIGSGQPDVAPYTGADSVQAVSTDIRQATDDVEASCDDVDVTSPDMTSKKRGTLAERLLSGSPNKLHRSGSMPLIS